MSAAGGVRAGIDWERRQRVDNWRVRKKGERKGLRMEFPKRKTRKQGLGASPEPSRCWMDASSCQASPSSRQGVFLPAARPVCGWKNERLRLSDRVFVCEACGQTMHRDLNAAIPLKHTVSSTEMNACGEPVRPGDIAQAVVGEAGTWQQASPGERFGQVQEGCTSSWGSRGIRM